MRQVDNLQSIDELEKYIHESAASYRHWNHGAIHLRRSDYPAFALRYARWS